MIDQAQLLILPVSVSFSVINSELRVPWRPEMINLPLSVQSQHPKWLPQVVGADGCILHTIVGLLRGR